MVLHIVHHGGIVMKRLCICILCFFVLCGCKTSVGSLEGGSLDMDALVLEINKESNELNWDMTLLQDHSLNDEQLRNKLALEHEDVIEYGIYPAVISAVPDEIMIFKTTDETMALVEEKVHAYLEQKKAEKQYLKDYKDGNIYDKELKIGNYYIVICSKDAQSIAQFIQEYA